MNNVKYFIMMVKVRYIRDTGNSNIDYNYLYIYKEP